MLSVLSVNEVDAAGVAFTITRLLSQASPLCNRALLGSMRMLLEGDSCYAYALAPTVAIRLLCCIVTVSVELD